MRVIGVDGCRGGWLAAVCADDSVRWRWTADIRELLALDATAVAIDIPIGLPEAGSRACDVQARRLLGARRSSVFPAPPRVVLSCASYAEARAALAAQSLPSMSAQAFGIVPAVRQVDAALTPDDDERIVEAHPELAFRLLRGADLASKKTADGQRQRRAALTAVYPGLDALLAAAPHPAAVDDALDALACGWVARRWVSGEATVLGDGTRDARGLPMRIVA
ncbi:MAG TPA: DUF429 domain-containing protein [Mycobacteriales bacterium]|nr:DUF429 domain-containing protein [Mycobacteriales bacterium]